MWSGKVFEKGKKGGRKEEWIEKLERESGRGWSRG
jgi:hypothetical protein